MDMVAHEAIAKNRNAMLPALGTKCVKVDPPVFVEQEDILAVVAP